MAKSKISSQEAGDEQQQQEATAAAAAEGGEYLKRRIAVPERTSVVAEVKNTVRETLFPEVNPLRGFRDPRNTPGQRIYLLLAYLFPVFQWGHGYNLRYLKDDIIAGLTIGSLCIPQDIGYAKLAGMPPIYGLYTSFVAPLIYALLGVSREIAIGPVAVVSILIGTLAHDQFPIPAAATAKCDTAASKFINAACNTYRERYIALVFTATFFTGIFQAALGLTRLGFMVEYLSHAAIVGFMAGAAITIALQQLKGLLGISTASFTRKTDIVNVLHSVFGHTNEWNWETILIGLFFLGFLLLTKYIAKKRPRLFWVSAIAPLISVILSTAFVKVTRVDNHGVAIVGKFNGKINPSSVGEFFFHGEMLKHALIIAVQTSLIALTEGIAIGRSFAAIRDYHIDSNKEMIAFGAMNVIGSCTSCYVATGSFSRSAVNYNAGCRTPVSNIVMSIMVLVVVLCLTPLFKYTPNCILSAIIINAVLGLIDYKAMHKIWKVDFGDFVAMAGAFLGVVFYSVEIGLLIAVSLSLARILLQVTRPHTAVLGNIPGTSIYRNVVQYPDSVKPQGVLAVRIDAGVYFSNANYIRERILRWLDDETAIINKEKGVPIQFVVIELSPVNTIDTTGIHAFEDLITNLNNRKVQLAFANPGPRVAQRLQDSGLIDAVGHQWFFLTVAEAVQVCSSRVHVTAL